MSKHQCTKMNIFNDLSEFHDPTHPDQQKCLRLRMDEIQIRWLKRIGKRNDLFGCVCGLVMLFMAGEPLHLIWQFGLAGSIGNQNLLLCCAGFAAGLFMATAPFRHRGRQRDYEAKLADIQEKLIALDCKCATVPSNGANRK
ncbi:hypothetical protein [Burkholderia gladioli]|uniref:hypothetical protein n=1 Tax=Burkholderia gladioli TaxID=28095 RepID=UPI00163FB83A|nr:hypothetical protein [Burkholderia gladioli]